jgi:hypothetical protein
VKLNLIDMDWTDTGARVSTNMAGIKCPLCSSPVEPLKEHLCGDKATSVERRPTEGQRMVNKRRAAKAAKGKALVVNRSKWTPKGER